MFFFHRFVHWEVVATVWVPLNSQRMEIQPKSRVSVPAPLQRHFGRSRCRRHRFASQFEQWYNIYMVYMDLIEKMSLIVKWLRLVGLQLCPYPYEYTIVFVGRCSGLVATMLTSMLACSTISHKNRQPYRYGDRCAVSRTLGTSEFRKRGLIRTYWKGLKKVHIPKSPCVSTTCHFWSPLDMDQGYGMDHFP